MLYPLYKNLTVLLEPFIWLYLRYRLRKGKEDAARIGERFGHSSIAKPKSKIIWIHAASVGESLSVLPLIERLCVRYPEYHVLLTTVTVTSAKMMASRLPVRAVHQYLPVDALRPVQRFLDHWQPDLALWVESELWPNLLMETKRARCPMLLLNARISDKSYENWQRYRSLAKQLLPCFHVVLAQTERVQQRFQKLGATFVGYLGNLKYDAPPLPFKSDDLEQLKRSVGDRPCWLAASTHPGEEAAILSVHRRLKQEFPNILTIIAPRHPAEGDKIRELSTVTTSQRSKNELLLPDTEVYIADTLGELGLFFKLSAIVFMGGSLIPRGGHNPLEPARMGCAVITGPYVHHFTEVFEELELSGGLIRAADEMAVTKAVATLLSNPNKRTEIAEAGLKAVQAHQGVLDRVLGVLDPYLKPVRQSTTNGE